MQTRLAGHHWLEAATSRNPADEANDSLTLLIGSDEATVTRMSALLDAIWEKKALDDELTGKLNGHAVRVPLLNASLTDCVFELDRETTVEEANALFEAAAAGPLKGILGYETRPLVSCDYVNDARSSIIDAQSTMVVNGTQLKVYAWYDNEWGYAHRLADVAQMVAASL